MKIQECPSLFEFHCFPCPIEVWNRMKCSFSEFKAYAPLRHLLPVHTTSTPQWTPPDVDFVNAIIRAEFKPMIGGTTAVAEVIAIESTPNNFLLGSMSRSRPIVITTFREYEQEQANCHHD
ncbi:hypothetical protein V6N12_069907 [Hibiscus sabdariffa]|uniref:Uncharacterized protein n=1 Tax=Hibiscus sabdariffa TaxID=183260 RepID=A0ABR2FFG3_9ROSI